jgi:hypothetical protein
MHPGVNCGAAIRKMMGLGPWGVLGLLRDIEDRE